jgi:hypothetical protein
MQSVCLQNAPGFCPGKIAHCRDTVCENADIGANGFRARPIEHPSPANHKIIPHAVFRLSAAFQKLCCPSGKIFCQEIKMNGQFEQS